MGSNYPKRQLQLPY